MRIPTLYTLTVFFLWLPQEIDDYIDQYSKKGYTTLLSLGSRGLTYATNVVVTTAIKVGTKYSWCWPDLQFFQVG